jgi:trans-aconitate methyltransferase
MLRGMKATLMADWDPELYNRFRRYRAEPVEHILSRLKLCDDENIIDLGCGSGENTIELARRSVRGTALGVDGSPAMVEAARKVLDAESTELKRRVSFDLLNVAEFRADRAYTLIFSNATFQWIPDHRAVRCMLRRDPARRHDRRADAGQRNRDCEAGNRAARARSAVEGHARRARARVP